MHEGQLSHCRPVFFDIKRMKIRENLVQMLQW